MATRKSNKSLWVMLVLIVALAALIFLLPSCGSTSASDAEAATLVKAGAAAPDFTVELLDGGTVTLSELRGKVVLVNFWATWCPPCRQELAQVQKKIVERFADREFLFLPISRGEQAEVVRIFRDKNNYTFPMGLDPLQRIYDRYALNFIPRNFLIGKDGIVLEATVGYEAAEFDSLIQTIEKTLNE